MVRGVGCVCGTRQGRGRSGGGDHNVEVHGGVGSVECNVGTVEWRGVVVVGVGAGWVCVDDLFGKWALSSDFVNDGG